MEAQIALIAAAISGIISIAGQLLQYMFPKRKTQGEDAIDTSNALKNITDSYDKLLASMDRRIKDLEVVVDAKNTKISKLESEIVLLDNEIIDINRRRSECEDNILSLEKRINMMNSLIESMSKKLKEYGGQ